MLPKNPKILVLYKRSSLITAGYDEMPTGRSCPDRFQRNHHNHYESLKKVEAVLKSAGLIYHKRCRSRSVDYSPFDLIISVGGDGTFLEAARKLTRRQYILGINSDPEWSVGQFCACDAEGFPKLLARIIDGNFRSKEVHKLRLVIGSSGKIVECLNDILICHVNPAAMSRYEITVGKACEEHRSSGVWFATAAGSTGAILSAGGERMPLESCRLQYRPRELYRVPGVRYRLDGGMISSAARLVSRMTHGCIFVDGAHIKFPFKYGEKAEVSSSPNFIHLIHA